MKTRVDSLTDVVLIVNVVPVLPSGTVTLDGMVTTAGVSLLSVTIAPPLGATPLKVTAPWDVVPPVTLVGLTERVINNGGFTVRVAVLVTPPYVAVMATGAEAVTGVVLIVNVALVPPSGTVTLAGTVTIVGFPLLSVTTAPPLGAGLINVTVPLDVPPPVTLVGLTERVLNTGGVSVTVM